jgi:hypothetical protein
MPPRNDENARGVIASEHKRELAACDEILNETFSRVDPWSGRDLKVNRPTHRSADEIVVLELSRGLRSYQASVDLSRRGYGDQAAMVNRSLFEGMAIAHWVHVNEVAAERKFRRAALLNDHLWIERLENTGWFEDAEIPVTAQELSDEEVESLKKEFGDYAQRLWTGHKSLRELIPDIEDQWKNETARRELINYLRVAHHDNNQILHSTVSALSRAVSHNRPDEIGFWTGPSMHHIQQSLYGAYWNFTNLASLIFDRFDLADRAGWDEVVQRCQFDFHRFTKADVKDVKRNDPCPCGSGKKFKNCHEDQVRSR